MGKRYECPECGNQAISVEVTGMAVVTADGEEQYVEHDPFSADAYTYCPECGHDGILEGFERRTDR